MSFIVNNTTFPSILDLVAPHSCRGCGAIGDILCERCKNNIILEHMNFCPNCKSHNPTGKCQKCKSLPPTFIVGGRNTIIGNLVHDFKYSSVQALSKPLAQIFHEILPIIDGEVEIIPLPTISHHIRERGLDHTLKIAKQLAKIRHYQVSKILVRTNSSVQVGSDRKTRLAQAEKAYEISSKAKISQNTTYLLLDDVWTTGSSMKSAIKKLKQSGAKKIIVAILAVS